MTDPIEDFHTRWIVREHTIPASHPRGFARGVRTDEPGPGGQEHRLRLAVKQYVPRSNPHPSPGDPTIILAHGVGSSKESYEPFVDALVAHHHHHHHHHHHQKDTSPPRVRAVWIPDVAWHGASYLLNRRSLGDSPHWDDSARDLLQLASHFRDDMPAPVLGVAQSWGAWALLRAAHHQPRLFAGLALVEPTLISARPAAAAAADADAGYVGGGGGGGSGSGSWGRASFAYGMVFKRDAWPSRADAREYLLRNPYYGAFDPAVFERVVRYDLRDVDGGSGELYDRGRNHDDRGAGAGAGAGAGTIGPPVTLTTPKAMEAYTMMRPWPPLLPNNPDDPDHRLARLAASGRHEPDLVMPGFHRPEPALLAAGSTLPDLLPPVQLVWAGRGFAGLRAYRAWLVGTIGTGRAGSGGAAEGKVVEAVVEHSGHPLPLEHPRDAAAVVGPWLEARVRDWRDEAERIRRGPPHFIERVNPAWVEKASKL